MLTIMVALHCEAKPIIDTYRLKKVCSKPFDHYMSNANEELAIELVVTGIGALAMATAVGWVGAATNVAQRIWLNLGTAGHATRELGELVLIHGVGDEVLQRSHYPSLVAKWSGATDAVLSVSAPCTEYPGGAAVDMEAYAFFNSALRFSNSEAVQSMKVISDNQESGIEHLNAARLTGLIAANLDSIKGYIDALGLIVLPSFKVSFELDRIFQLRGTYSQRQQVRELLQMLQVMGRLESISDKLFNCDSLKEALVILRAEHSLTVPSLSEVEING